MKIWLDDIRDPPGDDWIVIRNSRNFVSFVMDNWGYIKEISLDNDLGEDIWEGKHCANFLEKKILSDSKSERVIPVVRVHSANTPASNYIRKVIDNIDKVRGEHD